MAPAPTIGLVLPGGGARGAYEAGALSVLLPALEARGERVTVYCGTSVGAINAARLAATAHLPAATQSAALVAHWRDMRKHDVITRLLGPRSLVRLAQFAGELLELPFAGMPGVMDPAPLRASIERWIDWSALHRNVASGTIRAACLVASSLERSRPVAFVETAGALPPDGDDLQYVRTRLAGEHVRASAAIPLLFPPVAITSPPAAAGHYVDGGTRLNAPIAPALALGAARIMVIGFEPLRRGRAADRHAAVPRLADVVANVLDGLLVDQIADDVQRMLSINSFFVEDATAGTRTYRVSRGRLPYRRVSFALVAPEEEGGIGAIAERVLQERYGGLRGLLRSPDFLLLARVLGGSRARSRGELLSFVLFDEAFVDALIEAGRRDAQRWLDAVPRVWCSDPAQAGLATPPEAVVAEHVALDEYRALRRR